MKKILAIILAAMMLLSFAACNNGNNNEVTTEDKDNVTTEGQDNVTTEGQDNETTEGEGSGEVVIEGTVIAPTEDENNFGVYFWNMFKTIKAENPDATPLEIAIALSESEAGQTVQMPMAMPMEEDAYFMGFSGEFTVTGHESAAMFAAGMTGVAFMSYIFDLPEGADVQAFMDGLESNADVHYAVCGTPADTIVTGAINNTVFFIMCESKIPSKLTGEANIIEAPVTEGTLGAALWEEFKTNMEFASATSAEDVAYGLIFGANFPYSGVVEVIEDNTLVEGFTYEIGGFESAASFKSENADDTFRGYIFQLYEGMEVDAWAPYFIDWNTTSENIVWGAYNLTIVVFVNADIAQ